MDIDVDYHDSTSVAQKLKLIHESTSGTFELDEQAGPFISGGIRTMLYRARSPCSSSIEFLLSRNCIEHEWILFFIEFDLFSSSIRGLVRRSKEALAKGLIPSELRIRLN